jgi:hypothetical protein
MQDVPVVEFLHIHNAFSHETPENDRRKAQLFLDLQDERGCVRLT